jgi:hypothetical protein
MSDEHRAIERLIRQVDAVGDDRRNRVPRRIFAMFAVVLMLSAALLVLALTTPRRPVAPRGGRAVNLP